MTSDQLVSILRPDAIAQTLLMTSRSSSILVMESGAGLSSSPSVCFIGFAFMESPVEFDFVVHVET